jgi:hypothetical protein
MKHLVAILVITLICGRSFAGAAGERLTAEKYV